MSLDHFFKRLDARHRLPRPANALHLDAYQAGVRVMRDAGEGAALVAAGIATSFVLWKKELLNLKQALARLEFAAHRADEEIDEWVGQAFADKDYVIDKAA